MKTSVLGHSARHVTTLVDELLAAGFVTRETHPQDRRSVLIELTPDAHALLDEMAAARLELGRQLFGHLDPEARSVLGGRLVELENVLAELTAEQS
jgi:DNA-binding MarR family transcriptional regulator